MKLEEETYLRRKKRVYRFLKPFLFLLDAEKAHHLTLNLFKFALSLPFGRAIFRKLYQIQDPKLKRELFGLVFENPVGLAAGFDKDGKHVSAMQNLGFGFIEIGTVTPKGQIGNPQPRLFRLPKDEALINRMGFNNEGVEALVSRIKDKDWGNLIIGGNIGKNKTTPNEEAFNDYAICFEALFPYVHYFVVNVSSPNTPNLRALQDKEPLTQLLNHLQELNQQKASPKPILLKIAPDLNNDQLDDIVEIVKNTKIDGLIATNTTIDRSGLSTGDEIVKNIGNGGLSGRPLGQRSTEVIRYLNEAFKGKVPIIGVGGINSPEDAFEKLKAGAALVQVYSGLIFQGPGFIKNINRYLIDKIKRNEL